MHFNHTNNNLIMLDSESLNIIEWEKILVNIFIILLFVCINPLFALILCGFLNLTTSRINFWIFTFMFALSYALLFYLKDYSQILYQMRGIAGNLYTTDIGSAVNTFNDINNISWFGIVDRFITNPNGNEPLFWLYVKTANILLFGNASIFVFFHYFVMFVLIAFLGKIVDNKKFVIIVTCILLSNFTTLSNLYEVWRQTTAFLLFFIGIFLFDARERKWLPRIIIYSTVLVHISMVIIIVFYEFFDYFTKRSYKFDISKLYSKEIVGYIVTVALIFFFFINENYLLRVAQYFGLYDWLVMYYLVLSPGIPDSGILFNWFTYLILLSLWFRRKKISNVDVFIVLQYFLFIVFLNELSVPDVFSRFTHFVLLGGTIIVGRLLAFDFRFGSILLTFIFIHFYYNLHFNANFNEGFSFRLFTEYMNPVYGLGRMILNSDILLNFPI